jgi:hypothetical protein
MSVTIIFMSSNYHLFRLVNITVGEIKHQLILCTNINFYNFLLSKSSIEGEYSIIKIVDAMMLINITINMVEEVVVELYIVNMEQ